jgi:serine protease inhibitor
MKSINAWVSDKTREQIKGLIPRYCIDADRDTNAVLFCGRVLDPK